MSFDPRRYQREVLDPARAAGNRPTQDLTARYQLPEPLSPAGVRDAAAAVRAHWRTQRATLAYRRVIAALETEDRDLSPLLEAAAGGDLTALRREIGRRRSEATQQVESLGQQLAALADPLALLTPAVVDQLVAQGHPREDVHRQLRRLRVTVREPDPLPVEAPVRGSGPFRQALYALRCRHVADFLFGREALAHGFTVLDGFTVAGAPSLRLDPAAVAAQVRRWQTQLHGKTEPENLLTVLRPMTADQLRELLTWECAEDLRRARDALRAGTAPLIAQARQLGLADPDARRLAFAVGNEPARHASALGEQLARLLAERRVIEAGRLVDGRPEESLPDDARELAAQAGALAARALALRDRAGATPDPDAGWRLLDEAESIARDLPDLAPLRRRHPPHPPGMPQARVEEAAVVVSWPPSPSDAGEVRYRVIRSGRPFSNPPGGTTLAETGELTARDADPPANTPLHYAVIAQRGGVAAAPVATAGPVWFRPEVGQLRVSRGEDVISAAWQVPPSAAAVTVRRAARRPPRDRADGEPVALTGAGFADRRVRGGVPYHYLVTTVYSGPDGEPAHSAGVRFSATAVRPPEPVAALRLEPVAGEPGWLLAEFAAPAAGTVSLRELAEPPEQPAGTRLPAGDLPGAPVAGVPVPGGLKIPAPRPPAVLLAVTVNGDQAVIGAHRRWRALPAVDGPRAQHRGDEVLVTWHWPAGVGEVLVRWRSAGTGGEPQWRSDTVSAARYQTDGGFLLVPGPARRLEVSVAAAARDGDALLTGAAATVTVDRFPIARYTVAWRGVRHRRIELTLTADQPVRLPRLLLVAGRDLPLTPEAGELVATAEDLALSPRPAIIAVAPPDRPGPYWLRCFVPDAPVELRDPPRDQLRGGRRWRG